MLLNKSYLESRHLKRRERVNLGAFYTPPNYVNIVWDYIRPYVDENTVVLDPACGYGYFLIPQTVARKIGNDIDSKALEVAKKLVKNADFFNFNALKVLDRRKYGISSEEKLIVIGNPPYNDVTSQAKKRLKDLNFEIDPRVKTRDIGISFLRVFDYLKADYVCILHPLSYLIKKANFDLLKHFKSNYVLIDGVIISSKEFKFTSKNSEFPIIIALYKRTKKGMSHEYIKQFRFKTIEGKTFSLNDFDFIGNYIEKYPKKGVIFKEEDILFYTLRDINALKRNKTFLEKPTSNAIKVDIKKLDFYIYVDVFKDFINCIPYYFGNLDIIIDVPLFEKYKKYFISYALKKRPFLRKFYPHHEQIYNDKVYINQYFQILLEEHYNCGRL